MTETTPVTAWWLLWQAPMCRACVEAAAAPDDEIYGGYLIEVDRAPICPTCGARLDLIFLDENMEPAIYE